MGLWKKFVEFKKRMIVAQGNIDSFSQKTNLHCPKCNSKLHQIFSGDGGYPQNYVCRKCGYAGSLGLEIDKKKNKK